MTMPGTKINENLILGLDIGANSIGWSLIEHTDEGPQALKALGVRVFHPAVEGGSIETFLTGQDKSSAVKRRESRLRRRQLARRRMRLTRLARVLQEAGLLPPGNLDTPEQLLSFFENLDRQLFTPEQRKDNPHLLPYTLRARALDERLEPYELGRALYHLAHRRGFLSNRRVPPGGLTAEEEREEGKVNSAITELGQKMTAAGARTLGEYLASLDPDHERVRNRYLSRKMIEDEFEQIWRAQRVHHPDLLTRRLKKRVRHAIFYQRPLKSQRKAVGRCSLERGKRRARLARLDAQRFRLLQKVNDLRIVQGPEERKLTDEERSTLLEALEKNARLKFSKIRKLLGLPSRGCKFNFETEGEKNLIGNYTAAEIRRAIGDQRWGAMSQEEREQLVELLLSMHDTRAIARRARKVFGFDEEMSEKLSKVKLEDGRLSFSHQALAKLLPLMERTRSLTEARQQVYPELSRPKSASALPPLEQVTPVNNPVVRRALSELRRVVNAIVKKYGKPGAIRIELARDMKKTRKERDAITKRNALNRKTREEAAKKLLEEFGITKPSRQDIEKYLLAVECGWTCPYTGRRISHEALFGDHPQFEVEHIIPLPRSFDNSFMNKTLCHIEANRLKGNRTPWEAFHDTPDWEKIIDRVKKFQPTGPGVPSAAKAKLERFLTEKFDNDEFTSQQLNDTRYASRLAVEYVGRLYGADATGVDPAGKRRVQATRGQATAHLRNAWGLNAILGGGRKTRDDHRHHAIDALVVALTTPGTIKRLSDAASRGLQSPGQRLAPMEPPWPTFLDDVRAAVNAMVVSHRVSRKVSGPLHEETIYSPPKPGPDGKEYVHRRKPLEQLSASDIPKIVDPTVRACVEAKLAELDVPNPKQAFKNGQNIPTLEARDGKLIPIRKVRLREPVAAETIGGGARLRHVKLGSNHHIEVVQTKNKRGAVKWEGVLVSTFEAARRKRDGLPIINRDHGPGREFLFSLANGDIIELDDEQGRRDLYVVRTITRSGTTPSIEFVGINDARKKGTKHQPGTIKGENAWYTSTVGALREKKCQRVVVTPLGEVRRVGRD